MKGTRIFLALFYLFFSFLSEAEIVPSCEKKAGSLPHPHLPAGTADPTIPINHVIVMMQENHSFDNVLGKLSDPEYYGNEVDGISEELFNLDPSGKKIAPFHLAKVCVKDMNHRWDGSHQAWNNGQNDNFVKINSSKKDNGERVMGYYDDRDYPLMYYLADRYSVADRYFASTMTLTHPNRMYMYAATSFGRVNNKLPNFFKGGWKNQTIFDALNKAGVTWTYYHADYSNVMLFAKMVTSNLKHFKLISRFKKDADENNLSQVVFIENSTILGEEHPPTNFQTNQKAIRKNLQYLMDSPSWDSSAVFISYDEGGGNYDHVAPPKACHPDGIAPILDKGEKVVADFDRYGHRVPALVISPWAKRHHVSHEIYDHTSILKFIEVKYNVPALTARDANANPMLDMFDFAHPDFSQVTLPEVKVEFKKMFDCLFKKKIRD